MQPFPTETERIEFPGGLWIEIKSRLPYRDRIAARRGLVRPDAEGNLVFKPDADLEEYCVRLLEIAIVGWNLRGPDGDVAPINRETILGLDEDLIVNPLLRRISKVHTGMDESAKKA
jgi:hypothetical protein